MKLPEIPHSWLILGLGGALVVMRYFGVDSWTTAGLGMLIGYLTGQHIQKSADCQEITSNLPSISN